jgi:hypothetical protein
MNIFYEMVYEFNGVVTSIVQGYHDFACKKREQEYLEKYVDTTIKKVKKEWMA